MNDTPTPKPDEIVPLLRLGLEEEGDSGAHTLDATIRVDAPSPRGEASAKSRGWEPPSVGRLQQLLPQYDVTSFIARGGMGAVYKGQQKALKRPVAIKVLPHEMHAGSEDMQFSERFKHEAQAMARLTHPSIVAVFDAGETPDGLLYFVMEFIEGTDVAQLIASEGLLEPQRAIDITVAVCEALAFAHEEGIVHRDIKPSNIMIDKRGRVKVADFGLAKSVNLEATLLTGTNLAMGTPDFIAPEAMIPGMKIDQRADLYAVGVMLYQMLTGKIPRGRFLLPSGVLPQIDPRFDPIVDKAMQADREKRYSTAIEIKTDVEKVSGGSVLQPARPAEKDAIAAKEQNADKGDKSARQAGAIRAPLKSRTPLFFGAAAVLAFGAFFALKKPAEQVEVRSHASVSAASVKEEKWERIWNEPGELDARKSLAVEDGWVVNKSATPSGITLLHPKVWRDGAIRCEWRWAEGPAGSHLSLRESGGARYEVGRSKSVIRLSSNRGVGASKMLKEHPIDEPKIGGTFTLELRAVGTTITVKLDGREIIRVEDAEWAVGGPAIYLYGATGMRNIEVLNLDATESTTPVPLAQSLPWERMWNEQSEFRDKQTVTVENGWVVNKTAPSAGSVLFYPKQWRDGAIRCEWRWAEGSMKSHLSLRQWEGVRYEVGRTKRAIRLDFNRGDGIGRLLKEYPIDEPKTGDTFTLELRAVGTTISVKLDDKEVIRVEDTQRAAGGPAIHLYGAAGMRNIEVLNLDATESKTPVPLAQSLPWERMWNEQREFRDKRTIAVENGWVVNKAAPPAASALAYPRQWRDGGIRSEWRWNEGSANSNVSVRQWEASRYTLLRTRNSIRLKCIRAAGDEQVLKEYLIDEPKTGDTFTLELQAVGTTITAKLDGKEIIRVEDTQLAAGGPALYLYGAAGMRNIEVLNLDVAEAKGTMPAMNGTR